MNRRQWTVVCRDFADRERTLRVAVDGSEVVVVAPPGETAVLDRATAAQLCSAVVNATDVEFTPGVDAPAEIGGAGEG
jgi:hypothetical protein